MRFVSVKTVEQQAVCSLHTGRQFLMVQRTALINHCRGILADESAAVPVLLKDLLQQHWQDLMRLEARLEAIDKQLAQWAKSNHHAITLQHMLGAGLITATAFAAGVTDASLFKNGRQFVAWLGLVPKQYSISGKNKLGAITKTGDVYLRTMFSQGARSIVFNAHNKEYAFSRWIQRLIARAGMNKTVIAVAAKQARIMWAMMARNQDYQPNRICAALPA